MAYTYYGTTSDIDLAKKNGVQGNFYDVSKYGEESKYKDLLHAYKSGANPIILGGAGATGGINDGIYTRLLDSGANITRIGGKDRYEVQNNLKTYVDRMNQSQQTTGTTTNINPAQQAQQVKKTEIPKFEYNYNGLTADAAQSQIKQQLDPIYQRALENIRTQKYQNELDASQTASARGLAHSGLAADLQNKVAIAAQGQVANTEAERASKTAEMAQALLQQDQARGDALRQQAFQEYLGQLNLQQQAEQIDYSKQRDAISDQRYVDEQIAQKQAQQQEVAWREYTFKNMSASEKAQLEWAKQVYGEDAAWKMFELKYNGELAKSQNQSALSLYTSGFPTP